MSHGDVRHQQLLADLEERLADLGHEVVANRPQLVERCREASPDLGITEIKMLDLDGLKGASQIRGTCRPLSSKMTVPGLFCGAKHRPDQRRNLLKWRSTASRQCRRP